MSRSQRHKRYTMGRDSTGSARYPGSDYTWNWPFTWPSSSGQAGQTVPAAFSDGAWSVATGSSPREVDFTFTTLPFDGNDPITDVQYDVNGSGSWVSLGSTTPGTFTLTLPTAGISYNFRIRAVNSTGAGLTGLSKAANAGNDVPEPFVDAMWSPATGSAPSEIDVAITSLPYNGGSIITDIEYDVDASGTWVTTGLSTTGTVTLTMVAVNTSYAIRLRAVNALGNANPGNSESATSGADVPDAFVDADWSMATGSGVSEVDITVASLPATNGSAITDIEYEVDASGTWLSLGTATTGTTTVTMAASSTSYDIRLRAQSLVGPGAAGNTESVTSGAGAPTIPSAFVDSDWSVSTGSGDSQLSITVTTNPDNGGSAITAIEYDVDASGTWIATGISNPGTTAITMALGNTSYDIRLRAVNSVGNGPAGNTETATSASSVPDAMVDANWSVAEATPAAELDITIASAPNDRGAAITDYEYELDASGTWISLGTATTGTFNISTPLPNTSYDVRLRAVNSRGNADPSNTETATSGSDVPDAFVISDWSVATGSSANELDITISSLPDANGEPITNVQYDVDASGTWINVPSYSGTGTYTVTMAAASTLYAIRLRAVNIEGNANPGNSASATSGAGAVTVPAAFVDADWSVAGGTNHSTLDITVAGLPNNGGAAITDVEYDVDGSGTWISLGTAAITTTTVTMAAASTSYGIRLRAINSQGAGAAGNTENGTSTAPAITNYSYNGTDTITLDTNGAGTLYTSTTVATETDGADIENGVAAIDTDNDAVVQGTNNVTVSYPKTYGLNYLNVAFKAGGAYDTISNQYTFANVVPYEFVDADWSVATGSGTSQLDITIATLPDNGGSAITDIEYDVDASGTWVSLSTTTTGTYTVTMAASSTSYGIRLRAVNAVGNANPGNSESATSGAAPAVPSAFVDANWSVATGSGDSELDITIATLPADNGASITDVQYDIDAGGSWTSLPSYSGTGTYTVTMAAASTSYGIRLRAVNSVGNGAAGNSESATSGAAASGGITLEQTVDFVTDPHPSANPRTVNITPGDTGNIIVAIVCFEHGAQTTLDTTIDTGGGNIPTLGGNTMNVIDVVNRSRRHTWAGWYHPNSTSQQTFSFAVQMRGSAIMLLEYSGVDTTTAINGSFSTGLIFDGSVELSLTTTDADGVLVNAATFGEENISITYTGCTELGSGGDGSTANSTGGDVKDVSFGAATVDVVTAATQQDTVITGTVGGSECGLIFELNPA